MRIRSRPEGGAFRQCWGSNAWPRRTGGRTGSRHRRPSFGHQQPLSAQTGWISTPNRPIIAGCCNLMVNALPDPPYPYYCKARTIIAKHPTQRPRAIVAHRNNKLLGRIPIPKVCAASIPQRCHQDSLCLFLPHRPPLQPCRIAHSRILRCKPTTCHAHDAAGLWIPPSASIAARTRRRASLMADQPAAQRTVAV